jgi:hypothetical protein
MSESATPTSGQIYRVALASFVGSIIEQYDFLGTGVIAAGASTLLIGLTMSYDISL